MVRLPRLVESDKRHPEVSVNAIEGEILNSLATLIGHSFRSLIARERYCPWRCPSQAVSAAPRSTSWDMGSVRNQSAVDDELSKSIQELKSPPVDGSFAQESASTKP